MPANLKHSPAGLMEAFESHLVYEVSMLRQTYMLLAAPMPPQELGNALIESFCVHARNLIEFFSQQSSTPGQAASNYMGAKHFCDGYECWSLGAPNAQLTGKISRQIAHLTYDRTNDAFEKIGREERLELMQFLERELQIFGKQLRNPYREKWPFQTAAQ